MTARWLALMILILPACAQSPAVSDTWTAEIAIDARKKLGGCAVGDVHPGHDGNEVVAVASDGSVMVAWRDGKTWKSAVAYKAAGEMIQCAVGDVDPKRPGLEIVVVGMEKGGEDDGGPGAAHVVYHTLDGWKGEQIFRDTALIHGVCVAGKDAVVVGFSRKAHRVFRAGEAWSAEPIGTLPGDGKSAVAIIDKAVVVACNNGTLIGLSHEDDGWKTEKIDERKAGRARLGTDGKRVIVADDDGALSISTPDGRTEIYRESSKLRGAVLADLDPTRPGMEAATAGYSKRVTLLLREGDAWKPTTLYEDTAKFHHLAAGELDGTPGLELVACGYSGRVIVLRRTSG